MMLKPRNLGTYVPAQFNEPMNPIASLGCTGLGCYVRAQFNEPQNPFHQGLGCLSCGLGQTSSSGGVLDSLGLSNIGSSLSSITSYTVGGIPIVYLAGGGILLLLIMGGSKTGKRRRAAGYQAKADYYKNLADIQEKYGIRGRASRQLKALAA